MCEAELCSLHMGSLEASLFYVRSRTGTVLSDDSVSRLVRMKNCLATAE